MRPKVLISSSEVIEELRRLGRPSMSPGFGPNGWGSTIRDATEYQSRYTYSDYKCDCIMTPNIYPVIKTQYPLEHLDIDYSGDFPTAKPSAMSPDERFRHYAFRKNNSEDPKDWTPLVKHWMFLSVVQGVWVTRGIFQNSKRFLCKCTLCDTYSMVLSKSFDHKKDAKSKNHESPVEWQTSQKIIDETVDEYLGLRLLWSEPVILPKNEDGSVPERIFDDAF